MRTRNIVFYHLPNLVKMNFSHVHPALFDALRFRPITASLNITSRCNFRCNTCGVWRREEEDELSTAEWKCALRELRAQGVQHINFTGGEPLLRDDLQELTLFASHLGFYNILATNGSLLTDKISLSLVDAGVKCFCISVDALGDDFDDIRGVKGAFGATEAACRSVSRLSAQGRAKGFIYLTLMKSNLGKVKGVLGFAESLGLKVFFNLLDYSPYFFRLAERKESWMDAGGLSELDGLITELISIKKQKPWLLGENPLALEFIRSYFRNPAQKNIPCYKSLTRICLDHQGRVFGGCWSLGPLASIKERKLSRIMDSFEYRKAAKKMFFRECPGCSCGYATDFKYTFGGLFEEMKQAFSRYRIKAT